MNPDDNWLQVKDLCKDMESLTEIPCSVLEDLFKILENLIVHKFVENSLEFDGKDLEIVLPYIGSLVISSTEDKNGFSTTFTMRNAFYRKLKDAYRTKNSPLVSQLNSVLGKELVERFKNGE